METFMDTGYRRSPVDHRDWRYTEKEMSLFSVATARRLPTEWQVDDRSPILEYDQGDVPSCLAHAFAMQKTVHERKDKRRTIRFDGDRFYPKIALPGGGAYFRDAFRVARNEGVPTVDGRLMKIGAYYAVNPRNHLAVKHALKTKRGLMIGFAVTRGWAQGGGREFTPRPGQNPNEVLGGHGMFMSGWTKAGPIGPNSWGATWNNDGRGVLPWAYWDQHVWECWAIEDVND